MRDKFRVLVDWDNDGYVNVGVPLGAPTNLLPYPAYMSGLTPVTLDNTASPALLAYTELSPETHNDNRGLVKYTGVRTISAEDTLVLGISPEALIQKDLGTYSWRIQDFPAMLDANTTYTVTLWIYSDVVTDVTIDADIYQLNTVNYTNGDTTTLLSAPAETWTQVTLTFTTYASDPTGFSITIVGDVDANISAKGVMLVEGSSPYNFSAGSLASYDDISADVLAANWRLGRADFDKAIADEGTAEITLNNDSRKYSPANTSSPIYGTLRQNIMIVMQVETSINNWVTVWTGWVRQFKAMAGTTSNRQASIICEQGLYRLREGSLDYQLEQDITVTEVIRKILDNVGFRSAYYPYITMLNYQAYLGWSTYIQDVNLLFSHISETTRILQYAGSEWGRKTTPEEALIDVLEADNAKLWLDREGGLYLQVREDLVNREADHTLLLDTDVQDAEYSYGERIINRVEVFVEPPKEVTEEVIWKTKTPIFIQGHPFGDGNLNKYTRYIPLEFSFEEGKQRVLTEIKGADASEMTVRVYNQNPRRYADPTPYEVPSSEWQGQVHATVLGSQSLRRRLQVRNNLEYNVWIEIEITGSYFEGGEGGLWIEEDLEAQNFVTAVMNHRIELSALSEEEQALSYAKYMIHRYAYPYGEFSSITVLDTDLDITIGDVVSITEVQTGEENIHHTVIEEAGNYSSGGVVEITYTLARLDEQTYYAVGDTLGKSTINVVPNLLDKMYKSGGFYEKVSLLTPEGSTAYRFSGGVAGAGVLLFSEDVSDTYVIDGWNVSVRNAPLDFLSDPDYKGHNTEIRELRAAASGTGNSDSIPKDYINQQIVEPQNISLIAGNYFVRFGASYESFGADVRVYPTTSPTITPNPFDATMHPVNQTPTLMEVDEVVTVGNAGASLLFWTARNTVNTDYVTFGDVTAVRMEDLPTSELALLEDTLHYLSIWAFAPDTYEMRAIIIAEDGTRIYDDIITFSEGFSVTHVAFTTGIGNAGKHAIMLYPTNSVDPLIANTADIYFYGIAVTEETSHNTYTETNQTQQDLPIIYI